MQKVQAIVLSKYKYAESSIIVHAYTNTFGFLSLLISGVRKAKAKQKANWFQALQIIDVELNLKEGQELVRPKEVRLAEPLHSLQNEIYKSTVCLFLGEILHNTLRHEQQNTVLFDFLVSAIRWFDTHPFHPDFHLLLLTKLAHFLGFKLEEAPGRYFDVLNGEFVDSPNRSHYFLEPTISEALKVLIGTNFDEFSTRKMPRQQRQALLDGLILFYQLHLQDWKKLKSREILQEVMTA